MSKAAARWIVPVTVTALAVGGGVVASASADDTPDLPDRSAEDLLLQMSEAEAVPFSGTVRTVADLGLPDLSALTGMTDQGGGSGATDPASALTRLLSGENQLRVWAGGPDRKRVSLVDDFSELDVVRDGDEVWSYSSAEDTATRYDLAALAAEATAARERALAEGSLPAPDPEALAQLQQEHEAAKAQAEQELAPYAEMTPAELARTLLAGVDPTTEVAVGDTQVVAGRDAYTLTATPRDEATLVGALEVAVDAETGLVLQVEVGARDQATPAFVTGFTALDLSAPAAKVFDITPAPGTTVVDVLEEARTAAAEAQTEAPEATDGAAQDRARAGLEQSLADAPEPVVHGEGWSTVVELALPADALAGAAQGLTAPDAAQDSAAEDPAETFDSGTEADLDPQAVLGQLTTEVDGGTVFTSALLTVLLTDDGRLLVGSVDTATLQSYAD